MQNTLRQMIRVSASANILLCSQQLYKAQSIMWCLCYAELMEGPVGYDMSHAVWHNAGWQEMKDLRKKLENLKELRDLIKKLGRASGKGPKRRAPQEVRLCQDIAPRSIPSHVVGHLGSCLACK